VSKKTVSGTKEWAAHSANITIGCSHNCLYCYSRDAYIKYDTSGESWENERIDKSALSKKYTKKKGTIMFPTKHDITENNVEECITVLTNMLKIGNTLLIVSKPNPIVMEKVSEALKEYKDNILFRFTIGSLNDDILKFWEPGASNFENRKKALKIVFDKGFETSVSMEPLLDNTPSETLKLVESLKPYVTNSIWIGKMNRADERLPFKNDFIENYLSKQNNENIYEIYEMLKNDPLIKWKESIKKVVGLEIPTESGLDI
jgi:DNA repair photolyase